MYTRQDNRIFLIGYMGSGKSTIGKVLAKTMQFSFVDLDLFIEQRFHKSISQIFAESGELAFREIEKRMLIEISSYEKVIISTGGGTPVFEDNMSFMKMKGETVFLDVSETILANRLSKAKDKRPLIAAKSNEEIRTFIHENLNKRRAFYELSKHTLKIDNPEHSVSEIVSDILLELGFNL